MKVAIMKNVCKVLFFLGMLMMTAALTLSFMNPHYMEPYGLVYRTQYEIPAVLMEYEGVDWHNIGHWKPVTVVNLAITQREYQPEEVKIINITGDTCTILKDFGHGNRTYADSVPLTSLSYDAGEVEYARSIDNDFRAEIHYGSMVSVDYGNGEREFFQFDVSQHGADYPSDFIGVPKRHYKNEMIIIALMLVNVIINFVSMLFMDSRCKLKKDNKALLKTLIILNVLHLTVSVFVLWCCIIK
jgi:hypothetical protein